MQLEGIDILSLFFSALIHDYKHPGFTNNFLIQTVSDISTLYNGKNVIFNLVFINLKKKELYSLFNIVLLKKMVFFFINKTIR